MVSLETYMPFLSVHVPMVSPDWNSPEDKRAMLRVKFNPLRAIELAEGGSFRDIIAVLRCDNDFFPSTSHFRLFNIAVRAIRDFDYEDEKGNVVFQGLLTVIELGWPFFRSSPQARKTMAGSWKDVIGWIEYFYDGIKDSAELDEDSKCLKMNSLLMTTSRFFQLIYKIEGGPTLIYSYDKAVRLTARMWMTCGAGHVDIVLAGQIFSFCSEYLPEDCLDVEFVEDSPSTIVELAIAHIKKAARETPFDFRIFDIHHEILVTLMKNRGYRRLPRTSELPSRAIPITMKVFGMLHDISRNATPQDRGDSAITMGRLLRAAVYGTFNVWNMKQAYRCKVFPATIRAMMLYDKMDGDGRTAINQLLKITFSRWFICPAILARFSHEMDTLVREESALMEQLPSGIQPRWTVLKSLYVERLVQLYLYRLGNNRPRRCGDVKCRAYRKGRLFRCMGCETAYYCSPKCQRQAWTDQGHRLLCKFDKSELVRSSLNVQEREYMIHIASYELARHLYAMQQWLDMDMKSVSPEFILVEFCFPNDVDPARFRFHHLSSLAKDPSASPPQKAVAKLLIKQAEHPEVTINHRLPPMLKLTYTNTDTGEEESTYALADIEFDDETDTSESPSQGKLNWRHYNSASTQRLPVDLYPSSFYQHKRELVSDFDEVEEILCRLQRVSTSETDIPHAHLAPLSNVIEKVVKDYVAEISRMEK